MKVRKTNLNKHRIQVPTASILEWADIFVLRRFAARKNIFPTPLPRVTLTAQARLAQNLHCFRDAARHAWQSGAPWAAPVLGASSEQAYTLLWRIKGDTGGCCNWFFLSS